MNVKFSTLFRIFIMVCGRQKQVNSRHEVTEYVRCPSWILINFTFLWYVVRLEDTKDVFQKSVPTNFYAFSNETF